MSLGTVDARARFTHGPDTFLSVASSTVRRQLGRELTARLGSALVLSRLDYCNTILAGIPIMTSAPLQRVLNTAARIVLDMQPCYHVTPCSPGITLAVSHCQEQVRVQTLPSGSQSDGRSSAKVHCSPSVAEISSQSALRASAQGDFAVRRPRLKVGERAFSVAAPRLWNQLPTELKLRRSAALFNRKLKTFFVHCGVSESII